MKIIASKLLRNFKGEDLRAKDGTPLTVGKACAEILLLSREGGKMKSYILATKLYAEAEVEVDVSDLALIKSATEVTEAYTNLVSGQLLIELEAVK